MVIFLLSDNLIQVKGLKNATTNAFINNAVVTVTLKDEAGADVVGDAWPKTLPFVGGSNGDYQATLLDTLTLVEGQQVTAILDADAGVDLHRHWERSLIVQTDSQ
jgi:hypothetical protein